MTSQVEIHSYEFGFFIVPVRLLILVMTSKSLNKKNPLSLRPACPEGIDTKSKDINCLSFVTRSAPSMIPCNCQKKNIRKGRRNTVNFSFSLPDLAVMFRADCFPKPHVLCNLNATKCYALNVSHLLTAFDLDDQYLCVLLVVTAKARSFKKKLIEIIE